LVAARGPQSSIDSILIFSRLFANSTNLLRLSALLAAVCAAPNWAAAQSVSSFTVVDADTGADIATFTPSGTVSVVNAPRINVRANASNDMVFSAATAAMEKVCRDPEVVAVMEKADAMKRKRLAAWGCITIE
jgi:hypothetical protein